MFSIVEERVEGDLHDRRHHCKAPIASRRKSTTPQKREDGGRARGGKAEAAWGSAGREERRRNAMSWRE